MLSPEEFLAIRGGIATIPADVSNDAVGAYVPKLEDIYAPETHAAALDPFTPIVEGSRGAGKSFWSGVLGKRETRAAAAKAYPKLDLDRVEVGFGFTGVSGGTDGPKGVSRDNLNENISADADIERVKAFWWATILRAAALALHEANPKLSEVSRISCMAEKREEKLAGYEQRLHAEGKILLVVYDALDTMATSWTRQRLLTEALLEVVWAMRAYRAVKLKLFLRPDQIGDEALRFVELPKLRTGAVRLTWNSTDLYGLLYARLAMISDREAKAAFKNLLRSQNIAEADSEAILARRWLLSHRREDQARVMDALAGAFMAGGSYGYKKGKTYDWPLTHLADAFGEVTPRSFLGLMIAAAKHGLAPTDRVITPDGIRHGLRAASKTRVEQLHQEFPWIKGVLAPLAGLLLPQKEEVVFKVWSQTETIKRLLEDAEKKNYLPPFPTQGRNGERDLFEAMERIGVMSRRKDDRIDMPDLFRVAAKLLKKGGTAPL